MNEIDALTEKLWRAERALELLEVILPEKVEQAKRIASTLVYESTMGAEMWSFANGIDELRGKGE